MISDRESKLIEKLKKRPYRRAYVGEHVRRGISHQIRALREDPIRNWNQGELSKKLGKPQSVVSRMEDPSYGKLTVQTLLEVAAVFDVALSIRFVSFPTFLTLTGDVTSASMRVDSFDQSIEALDPQATAQPEIGKLLSALDAPTKPFNRLSALLNKIQEFHLAGAGDDPVSQALEDEPSNPAQADNKISAQATSGRSNRKWKSSHTTAVH